MRAGRYSMMNRVERERTVARAGTDEPLNRKDYDRALRKLHGELVAVQQWVVQEGRKVAIVFEGRDGAGKGGDIVQLGSTVKIKDVKKVRVDTVKLVGEMSVDPPEDYDEVTASSPMGEALMRARIGETVRVNAPRGVKRFEVVEIL